MSQHDALRINRINRHLKMTGSAHWLLERDGKILVRYMSLMACPKCGMGETLAEFPTVGWRSVAVFAGAVWGDCVGLISKNRCYIPICDVTENFNQSSSSMLFAGGAIWGM